MKKILILMLSVLILIVLVIAYNIKFKDIFEKFDNDSKLVLTKNIDLSKQGITKWIVTDKDVYLNNGEFNLSIIFEGKEINKLIIYDKYGAPEINLDYINLNLKINAYSKIDYNNVKMSVNRKILVNNMSDVYFIEKVNGFTLGENILELSLVGINKYSEENLIIEVIIDKSNKNLMNYNPKLKLNHVFDVNIYELRNNWVVLNIIILSIILILLIIINLINFKK